jgi:hypothetical protein
MRLEETVLYVAEDTGIATPTAKTAVRKLAPALPGGKRSEVPPTSPTNVMPNEAPTVPAQAPISAAVTPPIDSPIRVFSGLLFIVSSSKSLNLPLPIGWKVLSFKVLSARFSQSSLSVPAFSIALVKQEKVMDTITIKQQRKTRFVALNIQFSPQFFINWLQASGFPTTSGYFNQVDKS